MMGLKIWEWLLSISLIMSPVFITPLWYLRIKSRYWYLTSSFVAGIITYYVYRNPFDIPGVPKALYWYGIFFILYLALFGSKFKWTYWNKAVFISVYSLFIAGELWELPIFVYDYLGKVNILQNEWTGSIIDNAWIFSHMRRAYTIVTCYALSQIARIKLTRVGYILLSTEIVLTSLFLVPIGIGLHSSFPYLIEIARITSLILVGIIVREGLDAS